MSTVSSPLTAILLFLLTHCAAPSQRPASDVKFIVIGNTSPASPFVGYAERLPAVLRDINHEHPVLVIHTGNIIHGGHEWMGITRKDVTRQFRNLIKQKKIFTSAIHILAGAGDQFNGSLELFEQYTGEKLFYSFNYGDSHFVLLHIIDEGRKMSPEQTRWLREDLEIHKNSSAIFIFSHHPVISYPQNGTRYSGGEELHKLFIRYPVKAVISGDANNFYEYAKDNIRYIMAGCYGFNNRDWHWGFYQYYIGHYDGNRFTIKGVRVNFPAHEQAKIPAEE
ncbi:MAG: hypothetical protein A2W19_13870 [Spirochaetes bacterium RBG_16_49_21]|nr:MAG: hypothetical protein A2W19_13870 [Spirochaetes bacterium RBG_16_49_21]